MNRTVVRILLISIIIIQVVALTAIGLLINSVHNVSQTNQEVIAAQASSRCESGNAYRASDKKLWNFLLALPPETPQTPAQLERTRQFQEFLNEHDKPLICT